MKNILFTALLLFSFTPLFAQLNSVDGMPSLSHERFYVGGGGGLSLGSNTYVEISPLAGYRVTDRLSFGVQPTFSYANYRLLDANGNYTGKKQDAYSYGAGLFGRFFVFDNIFLHAQYELNNFETAVLNNPINPTAYSFKRVTVPSLLLGGGYHQPIGENSGFTILLLYDVIQDPNSPFFQRPVLRFGFNIGL